MAATSGGRKRASRNESIPSFALSHSQALWVLQEIGLSHGSDLSTFAHYVKSLRKLGIPFEKNDKSVPRKWVVYEFEQVMELAVALALRVYGALPDGIPTALRTHRERLYLIYRQAVLNSAANRQNTVRIEGLTVSEVSGLYLELGLGFEDGRIVEAGAPVALSAREAIERFALSDAAARSWLPLNLSRLAFQITQTAPRAPLTRSVSKLLMKGPQRKSGGSRVRRTREVA
jgi:hypothetical protein